MSQSRKMLVVAPHPDDEILGTGGTIARFARAGGHVTVLTVAAHMPPLYPEKTHERTVAEARRAHAVVGVTDSIFLNYPAVCMNETPVHELNRSIQEVFNRLEPQVVLLPYPDRHVDHRLVFEGAMVATRPVGKGLATKVVAAYETLSETHWNAPHLEPNFTPNWCVDISLLVETKLKAMECYSSQLQPFPGPRSLEALRALALFRGSQAGFGYGEAFHVLRLTSGAEELFS
jgi:LmbE family N-acetylglucosaminyl deacetylase